MQVNDVLNRITERNAAVVGVIARKDDRLYHNLTDFDLDCDKIADTMEDLLAVSDLLEGTDQQVDTVLAEYDGNCLIGQRLDDTLLVAVSDHLQRAGFKKLQVGLSLQTRLLNKALEDAPAEAAETPSAPAPSAPVAAQPGTVQAKEKTSTWSKLLKAVVAEVPEGTATPATPADIKGKTRKMYRGQVYYE